MADIWDSIPDAKPTSKGDIWDKIPDAPHKDVWDSVPDAKPTTTTKGNTVWDKLNLPKAKTVALNEATGEAVTAPTKAKYSLPDTSEYSENKNTIPTPSKSYVARKKQAEETGAISEASDELVPGIGFVPRGYKEISYLGDALKTAHAAPLVEAVQKGEIAPHVAEDIIKKDDQIAQSFNKHIETSKELPPISETIDKALVAKGEEPHFKPMEQQPEHIKALSPQAQAEEIKAPEVAPTKELDISDFEPKAEEPMFSKGEQSLDKLTPSLAKITNEDHNAVVHEILQDGAKIGRLKTTKENNILNIDDIELDKQGTGLGKQTIKNIMEDADKNGYTVTLTSDAMRGKIGQQKNRKLYQELGFTKNSGVNKDKAISEEFYYKPNQPMLSKGIKGSTTTEAIHAQAKKLLGKQYENLKGDMNIVQSYKDLPQSLRDRAEKFSSGGMIRGVYETSTGKVHLVADTMKPEHVNGVLVHELLHKAKAKGEKVLGESHDTFVLRLKQLKEEPLVKQALKSVTDAGTIPKHVDEEMMSYLVEKYQHGREMSPRLRKFVSDIIDHVKVFAAKTAVKLGVDAKWLVSKMNEKDIAALLKSSAIKQGEKITIKGDTLFSKAKEAIKEVDTLNQPENVKQVIRSELKRSIPEIIEGGSDKAIQYVAKKAIQAADIITARKVSKAFNTIKETKLANDLIGHKIYQAEDWMEMRDNALQNISKGMKTAEHMHNMLKDLSSQAREAMYDYVTGYKDVQLSDELKKAADNMINLVDSESKKQVANGTLSKEAYEEWAGQYLHRRYASKMDKMKDIASGGRGFTVEENKARGKSWTGTEEELKALEDQGKIGKVSQGKIEAEVLPNGKVSFRRDWTREERKNMGEIRDIAFSFPETYGRLSMLSEHGRMLKMVPDKYLMEQGTHTDQWMEQAGYTKLNGKKFGALNGRWVDNTIADDITAISERITGDESMKAYKEYVSAIKASHTIHNYKAHVNNTASGVIMQFSAGLNPIKAITYATQGVKALGNMKRMDELTAKSLTGLSEDESKELSKLSSDKNVMLVKEADQYGLFGRSQLNSILRSYISPTTQVESKSNKALDAAAAIAKANAKAYEMEDNMMRFAAFKQLREKGMSAKEAVKKVNDDIIPDYSKPMSKFIRKARDTGVVPFASWLYYSTPLLLRQLRDHPTRGLAIMGSIIGMDMAFGINPFSENDMPQEGYAHQNVVIGRHGDNVDTMRIQSMLPQSQFIDPYETYVRSTVTGGIPQQIGGALANIDLYHGRKITNKKGLAGAYQTGKNAVQNLLPTPDVLDQLYNIGESHIVDKNKRRTNNVTEPRTTKQEFLNLLINTSTYNKSEQRKKIEKEKIKDRK